MSVDDVETYQRAIQTKIQRWGNCLGLRIPKALAAEARFEAGTTVDLTVEGDALIVRRVSRQRYDVRALVGKINARIVHEVVETGEPVGGEVWW